MLCLVLPHLDVCVVCACVRVVDGWLGDRGVPLSVCMGRLTLLFSHLSSLVFSHLDKHLRIHPSSGLNGWQTGAIVKFQHRKAKLALKFTLYACYVHYQTMEHHKALYIGIL